MKLRDGASSAKSDGVTIFQSSSASSSLLVNPSGGIRVIEALGNIGDFVGGIGVVVTLLYLAVQIRQNSRTVHAASAQHTLDAMSQTLRAIGCSPQASRAFELGPLDSDKLTDEEVYQFAHLITGYFRVIEQAF